MYPIDGNFIMKVAPHFTGDKAAAQAAIVGAIGPVLAATLDRYSINTKLRIAHFMGQVTHECAGFRTTEEFASGAAYEGREDLGNIKPGDGKLFKGRGLIQLTGRANYRRMGQHLNMDLEGNPTLAAEPRTSLVIACEYWQDRRINDPADQDDLVQVTRRVNGGTNGLAERGQYLKLAKTALAEMEGVALGMQTGSIVLRRGSVGDAVGALQEALQKAGFPVAIDNEFGPATELALKMLQKAEGLDQTGILDPKTQDTLIAKKALQPA